jgi:hypothetical protein
MISNPIYRVDLSASAFETSLMGTIFVAPSVLVSLFGAPKFDDGDIESLGSYCFVGSDGKVSTVYMRACDVPREEIVAMQESFWASEDPEDFHVGAGSATDANLFAQWLISRVEHLSPDRSSKRVKWAPMEMSMPFTKDVQGHGSDE